MNQYFTKQVQRAAMYGAAIGIAIGLLASVAPTAGTLWMLLGFINIAFWGWVGAAWDKKDTQTNAIAGAAVGFTIALIGTTLSQILLTLTYPGAFFDVGRLLVFWLLGAIIGGAGGAAANSVTAKPPIPFK